MAERGVVTRGTGGIWSVRLESGEVREATMRGRLKHATAGAPVKLAVGDDVRVEPTDRGDAGLIAEILPRRSRLSRRAPGSGFGERVVVANVDQAMVVFAAAKPEMHPGML